MSSRAITRRRWLETVAAAASGAWVRADRLIGAAARAGERARASDLRESPRETLLLDSGWHFHLGHASDPSQDFGFGAGRMYDKAGRFAAPSRQDFDLSDWRAVSLPHDWAVELPFDPAPELNDFGYKPLGRNFPATSVGWYRRVFTLPASDSGRRIAVRFDGVFRDAVFVLNGFILGRHASGYAPVRFDVSDLVNIGGPNVLVVRVDATGREGWFYEGAGLYRHVWLEKTSPVHVASDGLFVAAEPGAGHDARITATAELVNASEAKVACRVTFSVVDREGRSQLADLGSAVTLEPGATGVSAARLLLPDAQLWSPASPHLYRFVASVDVNGDEVDRIETAFGVRSAVWDPLDGFLLNGERLELKGTCNHQDHAGVGSAVPDRLHEWRVARLQAMGCNAWRTAHNPPAPALLDACDRLGMLVIDETRLFSANDNGIDQLTRMVRRDRNHPCVVAWSVANEEWSVQADERGTRIARSLVNVVRALDPTRVTTAAMDSGYGQGIARAVDVQGINYQREDIDALHRTRPQVPIVGTETASAYSTRGIYSTDAARGYVSAYDLNKPDYGATAEQWWSFFAARRFLAGGFAWTGFDYRGEPSPYRWPCVSSQFGILDTCGFPKDTYFYYRAWWTKEAVLHLFPHWNWPGREGQPIEVWCYTNLPRVELFVNGRSAGARSVVRHGHLAWTIPYEPGAIEVREVSTGGATAAPRAARRETTGAPAALALVSSRLHLDATGEDVAVIEAHVIDAQGRIVPTAGNLVSFGVTGPARILGVGNGDPSSHEPDAAASRHAFNGLCAAILQAGHEPGAIRVTASSPHLASATLTLDLRPATPRPALQ